MLDGAPITPRRLVILAGIAGIAALIVGLVILGFVSDDGKMRELQQAPGFDLRYPYGTLLDEVSMPSSGGIGADHEFIYGTDSAPEEIVAYFDSELGKLGYAPTPPTPDRIMTPYQNRMLRQYQNRPFTYRLYLLPLPDRVNGKWHYNDFAHTLYTKIAAGPLAPDMKFERGLGAPNLFQVVAVGPSLTFILNGMVVTSVMVDPRYKEGYLGFYVHHGGKSQRAELAADWIQVRAIFPEI